jgi:hypothetical protein
MIEYNMSLINGQYGGIKRGATPASKGVRPLRQKGVRPPRQLDFKEHGGETLVQSSPGEGANFTVRIPTAY